MVKTSPSNAGGVGLIPSQETKIPHASWPKNHNIELKQCCNKFNKDFLTMAHIQRWIIESFGHPGLVCDSCASLMGKLHSSRILYKTYGEKLDPIIHACKEEPTLSFYCAALSQFSRIQLFATPWTVAHQAPLSMGFSRQGY